MNNLYKISEVEVKYATLSLKSERVIITSSAVAYDLLLRNWDIDILEFQEEFKILILNRANEVMGIYNVSKGGIAGTVVDAKIVFSVALKCLACSIILAHNHPSGNRQPSQQDLDLTSKLKKAGEVLDIQVLDHVILTKEGYYSFADEGMM